MRAAGLLHILILLGASAARAALVDDFSDGDYTGWVRLTPTPGASFDASAQRLEIEVPATASAASPARAFAVRNHPSESFGEVLVAAELRDWDDRDHHLSGVFARSTALLTQHRAYALVLNGGDVDTLELLQFENQVPTTLASVPIEISPNSRYRLVLAIEDASPVLLTGRLYHVDSPRTPLATVVYADTTLPVLFSGYTGVLVYDRSPVPDQELWATFDDFIATDPASDTDADGLGDGLEVAIGTDLLDPDSDGDGLLDGQELGTGVFGPPLEFLPGADGPQSISVADLDGDGDGDVLAASYLRDEVLWFENPGLTSTAAWSAHTISSSADGALSAHAADLDLDGDLDVLSASANDDRIVWYENDGAGPYGAWTAREISATADGARSVTAADLDGDGDLDVLSASTNDGVVAWYENDGTPAQGGWTARPITSTANGATSVAAADVDGDGDLDVLSAALDDSEIAWHENDGSPAVGAWTEHTISNTAVGAIWVAAADLDGDGDQDVLSASFGDDTIAWYQNDGTPAAGAWTERAVSTAVDGASSVFAADLDDDGDVDVLAAASASGRVDWFENDSTPATGPWAVHAISVAPGGGVNALAADLDGDGDGDVLVSSVYDDRVHWAENDGTPASGAWPTRAVSSAANAAASYAVDLDRDGDIDRVEASFADDSVEWRENVGSGPPATWPVHEISNSADGVVSVFAVDLDRDFDIDVLSASFHDDTIAWYENDGTPALGAWVERTIATAADGAWSVSAADLDGDGDLDVLAGSTLDDTIAWYRNDGSPQVGEWLEHVVSTGVAGDFTALARDVDGDFDLDIVAASQTDDASSWFAQVNVADPHHADSDDDALLDGDELTVGSDPLSGDTDGDGLGDGFEVGYGLDPLTSGDQLLDPDGDGLSTLAEQSAGTSPVAADTDGDGVGDGPDNCRITWNPGQEDVGGVAGAGPDGEGDACQCGDVDDDGRVDAADVAVYRQSLASPQASPLGHKGLEKCSVIDPTACGVVDVAVLRRALATPALSPGLEPVCLARHATGAFPTSTDADGDGHPDASDNCPASWNPAQSDAGGLLAAAADGVGDACQCGDVDHDGVVDAADVDAYRASLADPAGWGLTPLGVDKCSVIGGAGPCDLLDVTALARALHQPALPPGVAQMCSAAAPP